MINSFLDTTILINISEAKGLASDESRKCVDSNQPAGVAYYAIREVLAGRLRLICETHNKILAAQNPAEAIKALLSVHPAEGRKKEARIAVFADAMDRVTTDNPNAKWADVRGLMLEDLALSAARLWRKARRGTGLRLLQPLSCLDRGDLKVGASGELRGPSDTFNCKTAERCGAAHYLYGKDSELSLMIDSLHPDKLSDSEKKKNENVQRRKALKELKQVGPDKFSKRYCRSLGDAYFAAMCPTGASLITTNSVDFRPLCSALAKRVIVP